MKHLTNQEYMDALEAGEVVKTADLGAAIVVLTHSNDNRKTLLISTPCGKNMKIERNIFD